MKQFVNKLINRLEGMYGVDPMYYGPEARWAVDKAIEITNEVATEYSANIPQNSADGWIPCNERLPDTEHISGVSETVLVTTNNNSIFTAEYHRDGKWLDDVADWSLEVIAWMPLPAPYKEDMR